MNSNQLISNDEALRLFFNDDIYLVDDFKAVGELKEVTANVVSSTESSAVEKPSVPTSAIPAVTIPTAVAEPVQQYQSAISFKHLGKNEKGILILVNDLENPVSTPQGTELLRKLVLSINLKNADFALVNYSAYNDANFQQLKTYFSCNLVLCFGVSPTALGLAEHPLHQLHSLEGVKMIFTHNLHDLDADMTSKKALWGTLKNL